MEFKYFSKNGKILPIEQAVIPMGNIAYSKARKSGVYDALLE
ncbi:MAG TPA: hypothetical protein VF385_03330 [Patescibacteria group bacterium]